jgi:8-amino-7-oxononanoate synthase
MHTAPPTLEETFGFRATCAELARRSLLRQPQTLGGPQGAVVNIDGASLLNFCSNDYLGLAGDPRIIAALKEGADRYGAGAGASSVVCGRSAAHRELEDRIAEFTGRDRALIFCSGYMANLALGLCGFVGPGDLVVGDRLNHASLIDAARITGAQFRRYRHRAPEHAAFLMNLAKRRKLVLTDGVFSMDGDIAPVRALADACRNAGALLAVDDAHGIGVLGAAGGGVLDLYRASQDDIPLLIGTFGKSFGTAGAFIAGPRELIEYLYQRARTYIYTTALSPALAHAAIRALDLATAEPGRRQSLRNAIVQFRSRAADLRLPLLESDTPIQPLLLGSAAHAVAASDRLRAAGILVTPVRPPSVPTGKSRLRITLTAGHTPAHIDYLIEQLRGLALSGAAP